jgi:hypothetical protein
MRFRSEHAHDGRTVSFDDPPLQTDQTSDATHVKEYFD